MTEQFHFNAKLRNTFIGISLAGLILLLVGLFTGEPTQYKIWGNFLVSNLYFLFIALAGPFFIALQYVANAGWATAFKRVHEAMSQYAYLAFISMILILLFGMYPIYHHWSNPELLNPDSDYFDQIIVGKSPYLNIPFFTARFFIFFIPILAFIYFIRRDSLREDLNGGTSYFRRGKLIGTLFIVTFGLLFSMASFDWIMTIDAHWYSTIFGVYVFVGLFLAGIATTILTCLYLKKKGYLSIITTHHFHDLGKFLFGFSAFWAYIWFSQFLLIWYGNLPEENIYFLYRIEKLGEGWKYLFYVNIIVNFFIPFFVLMTSDAKKNMKVLAGVAILVLFGRFIDLYMMIMPGVTEAPLSIGFLEAGFFFLYGGIFLFTMFYCLGKANLYPVNHPYLKESKGHHIYP